MRTDHPASLTPEQRLRELAALLAAGLLRLPSDPSSPAHSVAENLEKSAQNDLEPRGQKSVTVHGG